MAIYEAVAKKMDIPLLDYCEEENTVFLKQAQGCLIL